MSNRDRAAHLIMEAARESEVPTETAINAVEALANAGLLAPDLPLLSSDYASIEVPTRRTLIMNDDDCPTLYENEDSILVGTVNGEVNFSLGVHDEVSVTLPVDKAVNFSIAVLAAAQYARGKA
ncbi:hypothetical protein [Corynebacterium sp. HMSC076D02]|uniref:hypothetical protein n=1 Tax=Corynebacterium sp. HMSC076D02 TaxID=1739439 RepID=UPI0008A56596|nr:hypothetical protein [Corynebacterium sp. HMSC076D02]OFQ48121.1 hypothetical protein HMPREF2935_00850 [Corynebacterium sp. HMSC076D02]